MYILSGLNIYHIKAGITAATKPLTYSAEMDGKPLFTEAVIVSTMKSKYSTEQQT